MAIKPYIKQVWSKIWGVLGPAASEARTEVGKELKGNLYKGLAWFIVVIFVVLLGRLGWAGLWWIGDLERTYAEEKIGFKDYVIYGDVREYDTHQPIIGATVAVIGYEKAITTSLADGKFMLPVRVLASVQQVTIVVEKPGIYSATEYVVYLPLDTSATLFQTYQLAPLPL